MGKLTRVKIWPDSTCLSFMLHILEQPDRLMVSSLFQLKIGFTGSAFTTRSSSTSALRGIHGLVHELGGFHELSNLAGNEKSKVSSEEKGMSPAQLQEFLWRGFFSDQAQWWDNRRTKRTARHPDFKHKKSKVGLWMDNPHKPAWVDSRLAAWDAAMRKPFKPVSTTSEGQGASGRLAVHEGHSVCRKLCEDGQLTDAVDALNLLVQQGCLVSNNLFYRLLKRCATDRDLVSGRRIHAVAIKGGYGRDPFVATHLIGLYAAHGSLEEAMDVFDQVSTPDAHLWATIIFACARHGQAVQAIRLYRQMRDSNIEADNPIYSAVIKACATAGDLSAGKEVHAHILASPEKPDICLQTGLLDMYAKCRSLADARRVFDRLPEKNVVTWNAMLGGYAQQGMGHEALLLYDLMDLQGVPQPDLVTFVCALQACASVGKEALQQGRQLHAQIQERDLQDDVVVGGSLVNMYAKCGSLKDARLVFDRIPHRNVVAWNAMVAGYAQQGLIEEALSLYRQMLGGNTTPNYVTFVCLLQACSTVGAEALNQGKQLHAQIEQRQLHHDVVVGTCLVDMYGKCGSLKDARSVFDKLPSRNVVTLNAMLGVYIDQGLGEEALSLYSSMQQDPITSPDAITFVCLLQACAIVAALPLGKRLHAQIEERGLQADLVVGAALVNMYAKCGSMSDSERVFNSLPERAVEAWGALTSGYARQGDSEAVFNLLDRMTSEGIRPDRVTFLSLLTVCSHVGLVDKGRKYFEAMMTDYAISPTLEHYICMIDLLGRAGHLDEAFHMTKTMPFSPDGAVCRTLLGSCHKWNNVDIAREVFEVAVTVDGKDSASYVLMSNIYKSAQMWEEAKEVQTRRVKYGAWKKPGQSWWTDMDGVVHTFAAGDKKHPDSQGIYARLRKLIPKMKKAGYVPHLESSLRDLPDDEKEAELCVHSERLAIAYALNRTPDGVSIRIVKNLRVCVDCHAATSYISKVEKRTIICRDASRFHVFKDGRCSCGDYW